MKLTPSAVNPARIVCVLMLGGILLAMCGPIGSFSPRLAFMSLGLGCFGFGVGLIWRVVK